MGISKLFLLLWMKLMCPGCCCGRGWQVALHIARGLHHMHSRKVMHLDLKSANILLARDGTAKVADVGLAKILTRDNTHVSMEGTFDWAAPEVRTWDLTCASG